MSSSNIGCCYIIIDTEFKEKHILEQDESFCCAIIRSELKQNKQTNKKNHLSFSLENSRPLSPPQGLWITFSSLGTLEFLSTYLGIDSLRTKAVKS